MTTGLPTDKAEQKIIAVQFDNTGKARPQMNMIEADVIYEAELTNGGYTRYTAIFNDTIPELVEAIRSARIFHIDIAIDWGATFVHFGGQQMAGTSIYDYLNSVGLLHSRYDGLTNSKDFYRDTSRVAPYNVVCRLSQIYDGINSENVHARSPLTFNENYTVRGTNSNIFRINYSIDQGYYPSYQYIPEEGVYYRFYNRRDNLDANGEQYKCANVIVMQADYTWYGGDIERPVVALTGTNRCDYFIGGKHFTGSWVRSDVSANTTFYDDEGNIVLFKPGKTFIQIIKKAEQLELVN
ncbi:MAG: DUF3048 domain-containing protein [Clostridia bacterium]|nr:DUF3048 domain-containing protein [Clostridia bacterium]